jgi:hypothetical protein
MAIIDLLLDRGANINAQPAANFQAIASWTRVDITIGCYVKGAANSAGGKNIIYADDALVVARDT